MLEFLFRKWKVTLFGTTLLLETIGKAELICKYLNSKTNCLYLKTIECYESSEHLWGQDHKNKKAKKGELTFGADFLKEINDSNF